MEKRPQLDSVPHCAGHCGNSKGNKVQAPKGLQCKKKSDIVKRKAMGCIQNRLIFLIPICICQPFKLPREKNNPDLLPQIYCTLFEYYFQC